MKKLLLALVFLAGLTARAAEPAAPVVAGLRPSHPRLIADAATWDRLRVQRHTDPQLEALLAAIEREARGLLTKPPVEYQKTGRRLLAISRLAEERTLVLATAYRMTGDPAFLRRAEREMLAVAAFTDWNPSHYLDVAEMTAALALGYDWLHADLLPSARVQIRTAIVEKGLRTAFDPVAAHNGWQSTDNNWNQVCYGGLILGALSVADEEPDLAGKILALARPRLSRGLKAYAPDGVFPEGPGYWSYGTSYSVLTIAALQTALGTDWQIPSSPGFLPSAGFFVEATAPSGVWFNFSDCGESGSFEPILFWFSHRLGDPGLIREQLNALTRLTTKANRGGSFGESARLLPFAAIWWPDRPPTGAPAPALPLRWHGEGPNPIAVFRSSWTDPKAFYLGLKGGSADLSHAHMDAGSFVLEAGGVRWARDLGSQEYNSLESKGVDLWNRAQKSQRWDVFRLNNRSHNTLTIDGQLHRVTGAARITTFSDAIDNPIAVVDLTPVFAGQASGVRRGFRVQQERAVLVQDELAGLKPGADVTWTMATGAEVTINADGRCATLRENGKQCDVRLLAPMGAKLTVIAADPPADDFNARNPDRRLLVVHAAAPTDGALTIAMWLDTGGTAGTATAQVVPLNQWLTAQ